MQQAVRDELETPKMQRFIAETLASGQMKAALLTPEGEKTLADAVSLALSSPMGSMLVQTEVKKVMASPTMTAELAMMVKQELMKMVSSSSSSSSSSGSGHSGSSSGGGSSGGGSSGGGSGSGGSSRSGGGS